MAFLFTITTKLNAYSHTHATKPIYCEFPTVKDKPFSRLNRAVRVIKGSLDFTNHNIDQNLRTDQDTFKIQIKALSDSDLRNIIEDIQQFCVSYVPDAYYSNVWIGTMPLEQDRVKFVTTFLLTATLSGVT